MPKQINLFFLTLNERSSKAFFFVALGLLLVVSACGLYISDSEFWAISVAKHFATLDHNSVYYKPLFSAVLKILYFFPLGSLSHIYAARGLFALVGLGIYGVYWLLSDLIYSKDSKIFFFLLINPYFFYQSFRVRSDLLAAFLIYCLIYRILLAIKSDNKKIDWWIVALAILAFLATPKAILFLSLVYFASGLSFNRLRIDFMQILLPILFLIAVASILLAQNNIYTAAIEYALNNYRQREAFSFNVSDFRYVLSFLRANFVAGLVLLFTYAALMFQRSKCTRFDKFTGILSVGSLILIVVFNQRYPFFIGSLLPGMLLCCGFLLQRMSGVLVKVTMTVAIVYAGLSGWVIYTQASNHEQIQVLKQIVEIQSLYPEATYADGMGLLPRAKTQLYGFPSPGDLANKDVFRSLDHLHPDYILATSRLRLLGKDFTEMLAKDYIHNGQDLFIRGIRIQKAFAHTENDQVANIEKIKTQLRGSFLQNSKQLNFYCLNSARGFYDISPAELNSCEQIFAGNLRISETKLPHNIYPTFNFDVLD